MSGIRLSEKHGLNPSLQKCFYCGNHKGILIPGRIKGDQKMPMEVITDLEPCEKCPDQIQHPEKYNAVILIEADKKEGPTGRFVVLRDSIVSKEEIEEKGRTLFIEEIPSDLIEMMKKEKEKDIEKEF